MNLPKTPSPPFSTPLEPVLNGVEFFEQEKTHAAYQARRATGAAPNELMEQDAFDDLLGDVNGVDILDLGCGDGGYGRQLLERGWPGSETSRRSSEKSCETLCVVYRRFVFSVEHPVMTRCSAARLAGEQRSHWLVDDYFVPGSRTARWFDVSVEKFHRSIEEYFRLVRSSRFRVVDLREGAPTEHRMADPEELRRRRRIPLMLLLSAER